MYLVIDISDMFLYVSFCDISLILPFDYVSIRLFSFTSLFFLFEVSCFLFYRLYFDFMSLNVIYICRICVDSFIKSYYLNFCTQ